MESNASKGNIELIHLMKLIGISRKFLLRMVLVTIVLGIISAFLIQKSYRVTTVMVPNTGQAGGSMGSLGGLASLAGINLGAVNAPGSEIPPKLYPQIVNSLPFQLEMLNTKIYIDQDSMEFVTYSDYQLEKNASNVMQTMRDYSLGLPSKIMEWIRGDSNGVTYDEYSFYSLTKKEEDVIENLENQIFVSVDDLDGTITLEVNMPDAQVAAILAQRALIVLQERVTKLKIKKAEEELEFTNSLYLEKRAEFEAAQSELNRFRDSNQNINTFSGRNELDKLEADFNLTLNVYTEIAKQLETAKLKIKEDTPSFSIIQPVILPNQPVKPRKVVIIIGSAILGLFLGIGTIFSKEAISRIKASW